MEKLTFQQLNFLCELNSNMKYVDECLQVLKYQDCIFQPGIVMPRDHISSLYNLRFDIAKERGRLSAEQLKDYEICVNHLNNSKSDFLGITWIFGENNSYFIFYEPDSQTILAILKSKESFDIKTFEEAEIKKVNSGFSSSAEKYSKGTFITHWHI